MGKVQGQIKLKVISVADVSPDDEKRNKQVIGNQKALVTFWKWQTCLNCMNWQGTGAGEYGDDRDRYCGYAPGLVPPPETILHGCHKWTDIPF